MYYNFYTFYALGDIREDKLASVRVPRKHLQEGNPIIFRTFATDVDDAIRKQLFAEKYLDKPCLVTLYSFRDAREILKLDWLANNLLHSEIRHKVFLASETAANIVSSVGDGKPHTLQYFINKVSHLTMLYIDNYNLYVNDVFEKEVK